MLTLNACPSNPNNDGTIIPRPQAKLELVGETTITLNSGAGSHVTIRNTSSVNTTLNWEARPTKGLTLSKYRGELVGGGSETLTIQSAPTFEGSGGTVTFYQNKELKITLNVNLQKFSCLTVQAQRLLDSQHHALTQASLSDTNGANAYVPNQVIVRYAEEGLSPQALQTTKLSLQRQFSFQTLYDAEGTGSDLIEVQGDAKTMAAQLAQDSRVLYAHPNYLLHPLGQLTTQEFVPNDPNYSNQWYLQRFGLEQAWEIQKGSSAVTIAIIDSGVETSHSDLAAKIVSGCDMYTPSNNPNPQSSKNLHGTHVAGIAAAVGNNALGISGVAPAGVKIMPIKVFSELGDTTAFVTAKAIRWAAGLEVAGFTTNSNPAHIINLSLGAPQKNVATLDEAVKAASEKGSLVVAASGNDKNATLISTPANAPDAFAVGSVGGTYKHSCFSNYASAASGITRTVDLVAPGGARYGFDLGCKSPINQQGEPDARQMILSTVPSNTYGYEAGTSMAAPFVSGVAALVWSQNPEFTAQQVRATLMASVRNDMPFYDKAKFGAGILCADKALGAATTCGQ